MNSKHAGLRHLQKVLATAALVVAAASVPSAACATTVSMGTSHGCSVADTSQPTCWGSLALQDQAPYVVQDIQVGRDFSCALVLNSVRCWGNNDFSQLGTTTPQTNGQFVDGLDQADRIAVGARHACALLYGSLRCWGDASQGQLGEPARTAVARATPIPGIPKAVQVAAGSGATCAVQDDGSVLCVGAGSGLAGAADAPRTPRAVPGISDAIEAALFDTHGCVLRRGGQVACWGSNRFGELGIPASSGAQAAPVEVTGLGTAAKAVAVGSGFSCALLTNGTVKCWGDNARGQLGTALGGSTGLVTGITDATAISAGQTAACAALHGGQVQCWGQGTGWGGDTCGVLSGTYPEHPASWPPIVDIALCRPPGSFAPMAVTGLGAANDAAQVLDWAEKTLPGTFAAQGGHTAGTGKGLLHQRTYSGGHTLAVNAHGTPHLLYQGPISDGKLLDLGPLGRWMDEASLKEGRQSGLLVFGSVGVSHGLTFGPCRNLRIAFAIHGTVTSLPEGLSTTAVRVQGADWSLELPISSRSRQMALTNGVEWPTANTPQDGQPIPPGMKAEPVLYSGAQSCPPSAMGLAETVDITVFYSLNKRKGQLRTRATAN